VQVDDDVMLGLSGRTEDIPSIKTSHEVVLVLELQQQKEDRTDYEEYQKVTNSKIQVILIISSPTAMLSDSREFVIP